jgi:hypothetical protein
MVNGLGGFGSSSIHSLDLVAQMPIAVFLGEIGRRTV